MKIFKSITDGIVKVTEILLMLLVAGLVGLIVYELTIRNLFNKSFRASIEICGILFMWMTFLGIIYLYDKSRLMRFDILLTRVGKGLNQVFWVINKAASLMLGVVMVIAFISMYPFFSTRFFSTIPSLSYAIMFIPMGLAGAFIALKTVLQMIDRLCAMMQKKPESGVNGGAAR